MYQCFDETNEHMIHVFWVKFIQKVFVHVGNGPERSAAQKEFSAKRTFPIDELQNVLLPVKRGNQCRPPIIAGIVFNFSK